MYWHQIDLLQFEMITINNFKIMTRPGCRHFLHIDYNILIDNKFVYNFVRFGQNIGIAFQLVDDWLDFVASADQLGNVVVLPYRNHVFNTSLTLPSPLSSFHLNLQSHYYYWFYCHHHHIMLLINTIPLRKASWSRSWPRYCHRTGICWQKFRKFTIKSSAKMIKSFNNNFIVIYFQVLFASEQFPRLNTLILRFVFEKNCLPSSIHIRFALLFSILT